jgi:hypothetical protein
MRARPLRIAGLRGSVVLMAHVSDVLMAHVSDVLMAHVSAGVRVEVEVARSGYGGRSRQAHKQLQEQEAVVVAV